MKFTKGNPHRFQKGNPGGPGRPSRDAQRKALEEFLLSRFPVYGAALDDKAAGGDVGAIRLAAQITGILKPEQQPATPPAPQAPRAETPEDLAMLEKQARLDAGLGETDDG